MLTALLSSAASNLMEGKMTDDQFRAIIKELQRIFVALVVIAGILIGVGVGLHQ
jgi:hypothetical protein